MAATVYTCPEGLEEPDFDAFMGERRFDTEAYFDACEKHQEQVAEWCRLTTTTPGPLIGETIRFPVADGQAVYMVWKTKPLTLIHLAYVDGYEVSEIMLRGLRVSDVREMVEREQRIQELFS